jgi:hypothetical protein
MVKRIWELEWRICKDRKVKVFFSNLPLKHRKVTVKYMSSFSKQNAVLCLFLAGIKFKPYCLTFCKKIQRAFGQTTYWNLHFQGLFRRKYSLVSHLYILVPIFEILLPSSFCPLIFFNQCIITLTAIILPHSYKYFVKNINQVERIFSEFRNYKVHTSVNRGKNHSNNTLYRIFWIIVIYFCLRESKLTIKQSINLYTKTIMKYYGENTRFWK